MTPEELAAKEAAERAAKEPSQKSERTEKEKAAFTLKKNAERLQELGGDPIEVLGVRPQIKLSDELPDDKPITVKDLREIQKRDASQTALQKAESIEDETERDAVKDILSNRIVPSGDSQRDLREAQAIVNAEKNAKILEELARKNPPKRTAAGGSQAAAVEEPFEPTPQEALFMRAPYNLSKEKIMEQRKKEQQ